MGLGLDGLETHLETHVWILLGITVCNIYYPFHLTNRTYFALDSRFLAKNLNFLGDDDEI